MTGVEPALEQAIDDYFAAFAEGFDVPPARRFFLEGYLQALVDSGQLSREEVLGRLARACEKHLDAETAQRYRDANEIVLHSHMRRAPVYPSG